MPEVKKRFYHLFAPAAAALILSAALFISIKRSVKQAVDQARAEELARDPGAALISSVSLSGEEDRGLRVVTSLAPAVDALFWNGSWLVATDGGLAVIRRGQVTVRTAADGLPGSRITCLAGWRGLAIIGTTAGIAVLDKNNLRAYRFADDRRNHVSCLLARSDNVLIGSLGGGLLVYDGSAFKYHPALADRPDLMITALCPWGRGAAAGAWSGEVFLIEGKSARAIGPEDGVLDPVTALAEDHGRLLIGSPLALKSWRPDGRVETVLADAYVSSITPADNGLVLAAMEQGIVRLTGRAARKTGPGWVVSRVVVQNGSMLALGEKGVIAVDGEAPPDIEAFARAGSGLISENRLTAVAEDSQGRLWAGTFEKGVDVINPDLTTAAHLVTPGFETINCIRPDPFSARVFVGTGHGLLIYSGLGPARRTTTEEGLIGEAVFDVLPQKNGVVVATNRGITFLSPSGASSICTFHGLVNNHVYCLAAIGDIIAAGTLGGLSMIENQRVTMSCTMDNSPLPHNWITSLVAGPGGELYIGTFGGGVAAMEADGSWMRIEGAGADINQNAMMMFNENILAGTFGSGLMVIDRKRKEARAFPGRLSSANVTGIAGWDAAGGRVVLATDGGLCILDAAGDF